MNKNDPEIIDGAAIEETRPSRLPCLIKKIAMASLVLGSISLLVLTYYSYVVLTSKIAQLEKQVAALPEAFAAYTKPQSTTSDQSATELSPAHDAVVTEAARKEENAGIDSKKDELLSVIVAVSELREAARRGAPYDKELAVVEQRHDPVIAEKIAVIKPYAQSGIKDIAKLRENFKEMLVVIQSTKESEQKKNLSDLSKQFSSLIKIRKINEDTEAGSSTEAIIMRTEKALNDADIPKAIAELSQLQDEEIKKHSAAWLTDAEHSLAVMQQSEALYQHVIKLPLKGQP